MSKIFCLFCDKAYNKHEQFISHNNFYVCEGCLRKCVELIEKKQSESIKKTFEVLKPKEIFEKLNQYVIGQEETKKTLSYSVYNHLKRINNKELNCIEKSNILLIGPSGSGKTLLAKTLSKILDLPFIIFDATSLTQTGYVGEDVDTIIQMLYKKANYDLKKAERGIVFIDEVDKIAKRDVNTHTTRDISGEGVQQALLKIMEGTILKIASSNKKTPFADTVDFDTSNVLFIFSGAFVGLKKYENEKGNNIIGFNSKNLAVVKRKLLVENLENYGFISEFIGRIPVISKLNNLTREDLKTILLRQNGIFNDYKKILSVDDVKLDLTDEAIDYILDYSTRTNTGARGLKNILEEILKEISFNLVEGTYNIDLNFIKERVKI